MKYDTPLVKQCGGDDLVSRGGATVRRSLDRMERSREAG
jgi:hypothetical protein